eukprot:13682169-Alexandrium_andersonii.AAC.1
MKQARPAGLAWSTVRLRRDGPGGAVGEDGGADEVGAAGEAGVTDCATVLASADALARPARNGVR